MTARRPSVNVSPRLSPLSRVLQSFSRVVVPALLLIAHAPAEAQDVARWQERGQFNIGYRTHAPPFAYDSTTPGQDDHPVPTGYSVDICRRIEAMLAEGHPGIRVEWKGVKSSDRLEKLEAGEIDLLCGTTTVALNRLMKFESSLFTFLTGASFVCTRDSRATSVADMAGLRVGFLKGSTTEAVVDRELTNAQIEPGSVKRETLSYEEAMQFLTASDEEEGKLDCFFGDRDVLAHYVNQQPANSRLFLSGRYFSLEPYGIFMRRGDPELANLVNTALVDMFEADPNEPESIHWIFRKHFPQAQMSGHLRMLFEVQQLPRR